LEKKKGGGKAATNDKRGKRGEGGKTRTMQTCCPSKAFIRRPVRKEKNLLRRVEGGNS